MIIIFMKNSVRILLLKRLVALFNSLLMINSSVSGKYLTFGLANYDNIPWANPLTCGGALTHKLIKLSNSSSLNTFKLISYLR
jgi:hypothetical protein